MSTGISIKRNPSSSEFWGQFISGVWKSRGKDFNVFNPRRSTNRAGDMFLGGTIVQKVSFTRRRVNLQFWVIVAAGVGSGLIAGALAVVISRI